MAEHPGSERGDGVAGQAVPAELVARGTTAFAGGDPSGAVRLLQRAHTAYTEDGQTDAALTTACLIAMVLGMTGQRSQSSGWAGRAHALLEELDERPSAGRGYFGVLQMSRALATGDLEGAAPIAAVVLESGRAVGSAALEALGLIAQGRHAIATGDVPAGLRLLDEGMAVVLAGDASAFETGLVWCGAIEGCQQIGAVDRLREWTAALAAWLDGQPQLSLFDGECALHRAQVLALQGAWAEASDALRASREHYELQGQTAAAGAAVRELGDVQRHQGELAAAEASYRTAAELGCDPQPGLALLWLERGQEEAALGAMRRCLAETRNAPQRLPILPAAVETLLAVGEVDEAVPVADELERIARESGCVPAAAAAAHAHAAVELARFDAAGALPYARAAVRAWTSIDCPFEAARSRMLLGEVLAAVGDAASSRAELEAARAAFSALGAARAMARAASMLEPDEHGPGGLTHREVEVLRLVARGRSNRQIAGELVISDRTVARHLSNIFVKLAVGSRTEAAAYAFEHRLA